MERMYLHIIKAIYDKHHMYKTSYIANIILSGEKKETIFLKIRNETRMPTLSTPIQHSPGIPSQSNKARRRNKGIQIGEEIDNVSLFADDMILYFKDPKNSTQKLLDTTNSFSNYRIQNQLTKISSLSIHQ
jgi:hypothetical protein